MSSEKELSLSKEGTGFSVTKEFDELTGSEESTKSSLVEIYMSIGTEVEIPTGIRLIELIEMSIDPECD